MISNAKGFLVILDIQINRHFSHSAIAESSASAKV